VGRFEFLRELMLKLARDSELGETLAMLRVLHIVHLLVRHSHFGHLDKKCFAFFERSGERIVCRRVLRWFLFI
jgi:hypothetical protein